MKQGQLFAGAFCWKVLQIFKNLSRIVHNTPLRAGSMEDWHQPVMVVAGACVGEAEPADILLLHSWKMTVQRRIEIFAVAFAHSGSDTETEDACYTGVKAVIQYAAQIFLRIIDKGEQGREPNHRGNSVFLHDFQYFISSAGGADVGFENAAQRFVIGGHGHFHHAFALGMNALQQVKIPQDPVRFGED